MADEGSSDTERLTALLDVVERRGLRVSAVAFGDVRIQLFEPWPRPAAAPERKFVKDDEDPALGPLRKSSLELFGHIKSNEELKSMHADGLL